MVLTEDLLQKGSEKNLKERIDTLLVEQGFFKSRERAKAALMEGIVFIGDERIDKAGMKVDPDSVITVKGDDCPYVSRGGYKLEKAIEVFDIDLKDKKCADIGASTGGFTDCMLQSGASKVYSIDVGYGQLDWKLRQDPRVVNIERCNVRYLEPEQVPEQVDFISVDVSFISLALIFPVMKRILKENGKAVCLIKPQFEAGREEVSAGKGVIHDPKVHEKVIQKVIQDAEENGFYMAGLSYSPVKGAKGNIEYLISLETFENLAYNATCVLNLIQEQVGLAHDELG